MSELYLVAHKVRGEPAFDVASRVECPSCHGGHDLYDAYECVECDSTGFWWIIPTSGHRAYPWWSAPIVEAGGKIMLGETENPDGPVDMPPNLPDHYTSRASPTAPSGLAQLLAKRKPLNVERRGR